MRTRSNHWRTDVDIWLQAGPSRRVRKAYAALAVVAHEMETIRRSHPCPEHAPTSAVIISYRLREAGREYDRLLKRIGNLDGDDESYGRGHIKRVRDARLWGRKNGR